MHYLLRIFTFAATLFTTARANDADVFAAVIRADEQRIAATLAGNVSKLGEFLSTDLHYANSDGRVQNRDEFLAAVRSNKIKYLSFDQQDVKLQAIAPGVVAINGQARYSADAGGRAHKSTLRFLGIWREESGQWRLVAYQSAQLSPPPVPTAR